MSWLKKTFNTDPDPTEAEKKEARREARREVEREAREKEKAEREARDKAEKAKQEAKEKAEKAKQEAKEKADKEIEERTKEVAEEKAKKRLEKVAEKEADKEARRRYFDVALYSEIPNNSAVTSYQLVSIPNTAEDINQFKQILEDLRVKNYNKMQADPTTFTPITDWELTPEEIERFKNPKLFKKKPVSREVKPKN